MKKIKKYEFFTWFSVFRMLLYKYDKKLSFTYKKKRGNFMFIYWVIILVLLAKVFTFFETNKLKIVKRGKLNRKVY